MTNAQIHPGHTIRFRMRAWLAKAKDLPTRVWEGEVVAVTQKAVLVEAHAVAEAADHCHRCGREIKHPGSRLIGYGPDCAEKLGLPWLDVEEIDEKTLAEIQARIRTEVVQAKTWIPFSQVDELEITGGEPKKPEPKPTTATTTGNGRPAPRPKGDFVLRLHDGRIAVAAAYRHKDLLKSLTGRLWDKREKAWTYPASPLVAQDLLEAITKAGTVAFADDVARDRIQGLLDQAGAIAGAQDLKSRAALPDIDTVRTEAWLHQRQAFHFAKDLGSALLYMHMGTGKTLVSIGLIAHEKASVAVVLAPKRVIQVWPKDFAKHTDLDGWKILPLSNGSTAKRAKEVLQAAKIAKLQGDRLVVVVNYEAAWRGDLAKALVEIEPEFVVFDEIHRIKSPSGKASKYAQKLASLASVRKRLGLSGTIMPHGPLDVYAQMRALEPGLFGTSFQAFKTRYASLDHWGGVDGYKNLDELHGKLSTVMYRAEKGVLDLPDVMDEEIQVEISPKARKLYQDLEDTLYAAWGEGEISVTNALTQLLRLQQITSGFAQLDEDDPGTLTRVDTAKEEALRDLLEDLPQEEPVVVFTVYRADIEIIRQVVEASGRRFAELSGSRDDLETWQQGGADVIGVNIRAGGLGVDLTRAHYGVYFSQTFSLGDYEQSRDRLHRPGQDQATAFYHLIARDTVDERIYHALRSKRKVVDAVMASRETPAEPIVEPEDDGRAEAQALEEEDARDLGAGSDLFPDVDLPF